MVSPTPQRELEPSGQRFANTAPEPSIRTPQSSTADNTAGVKEKKKARGTNSGLAVVILELAWCEWCVVGVVCAVGVAGLLEN